MQLLLSSSRRFFRHHPGQLLLALMGMAAGVAVMTGVALMQDVLTSSLEDASQLLAGQDSLRISAPGRMLDEQLYAQLARLPGAPALTPVLHQQLQTTSGPLELMGLDALSGRGGALLPGQLINRLSRLPHAATATAATLARLNLRAGEVLELQSGPTTLRLELTEPIPAGPGLEDHLILDLGALQDLLARQGQLSWLEAPASSEAWLRTHLPAELQLSSASQRRDSAARLTAGMRANLAAMGMISLAVGMFVIFSVFSFLLVQRRPTLAMLRALGVTGSQLTILLLIETLVIAGFGSLLGLSLGTLLARRLVLLVREPAADLYGLHAQTGILPSAGLYLLLGLAAMGCALLAVSSLLRDVRSIPPGQILRQPVRTMPSGRFASVAASGALMLASALVILFTTHLNGAFAGLFLALAAVALLTPGAGLAVLRFLSRHLPWTLPARALALLLAAPRRIRPALAALSLALALAVGLAMMVLGFRAAVDGWIDQLLRADGYVSAQHGGLDEALAARIAALPGIAYTSSSRRSRLADGREVVGYGLPERGWRGFEWLAGDPEQAHVEMLANRAAIISEPLARRQGLGVGDRIQLPGPEGALELPVVAIYRDYASEHGTIAIHAPLYQQHFRDPVVDQLALYAHAPGLDVSALETALAALDPRLRFIARDAVHRNTMQVFDRTFRISWALAALVGLIAIIALISALLALGLERRRDYATLRALGLSPRGLHAFIVSQTAGLALAAALVAVPLALAIHLGLSLIIQPRAFGWTLPLSWPLEPVFLMLPLALVCGMLAGLYPAWRIGRRDPARELRSE